MSDFSELLLSMGRALKPLQREWVRTLPRPRTKVPEEKGGPGPTLAAFAGWSCCAGREVC